jgi:hypothetical protein
MSMVDDPALLRIERVLNDLRRCVGDRVPVQMPRFGDDTTPDFDNTEADRAQRQRLLRTAQGWIRIRQARNRAFGSSLFSDPAWCILLDVFVGEQTSRSTSISALCAASNIPQSTGLRWILILEETGLVRREVDPLDRRRTLIRLTEAGSEQMRRVLRSVADDGDRSGIQRA